MRPKFFATTNKNKLREVSEILGEELKLIELELVEPQAIDVEQVVKEKAKHAFVKTGKSVLVEDTGIYFSAWNGLPGALAKWFLLAVGNKGILKMMANESNRKAIAKTAVGFYDGKNCHIYTGEIKGKVAKKIQGQNGFGWDPIFIPDGHKKSFAEMTPVEKNRISMRYLAMVKLKEELL